MAAEVKRGGRVEYPCSGCGKNISKGEPHFKAGGKAGSKRFHSACLPSKGKKGTPVEEPTDGATEDIAEE